MQISTATYEQELLDYCDRSLELAATIDRALNAPGLPPAIHDRLTSAWLDVHAALAEVTDMLVEEGDQHDKRIFLYFS